MQRVRIVSYRFQPGCQRLAKPIPKFSQLRSNGAEIRVYHPSQKRAIVDAAWDSISVIVVPHIDTPSLPAIISPYMINHALIRSDTYRKPSIEPTAYSIGAEQAGISRIVSLLDNMEGGRVHSLKVRIEPRQLSGWLSQWEHGVEHALAKFGNLNSKEAQDYLYKKLVVACYYC